MPTRILIADDDPALRGLIVQMLQEQHDWEICAEAENGQEAVFKAALLKPDLVILDWLMPVMNGLQAAAEILKILPTVPVVINTLHQSTQLDAEARKVGVRQVVSKTDANALTSAVEAAVNQRAPAVTPSRPPAAEPWKPPKIAETSE